MINSFNRLNFVICFHSCCKDAFKENVVLKFVYYYYFTYHAIRRDFFVIRIFQLRNKLLWLPLDDSE